MNIFMITHKQKFSSLPRSYAMGQQMVLRGHRVTLMLISEHKRTGITEYEWDGIRVIETPDLLWGRLRSGWDPWDVVNRCLFLRKVTEHYDLIHCFETRPATIYPALYFSNKNHIPIITDWNDWWGHHGLIDVNRPFLYRHLAGWIETYFEEAFRVKAAGLTVIAKGLEQRAIQLGVNPENICYISGGASIDWCKQRNKEECRNLAKLPLEGPILGFGSADSYLDFEIILASLALVIQKYPGTKLIITGKTSQSVRNLIRKYQLADHIILTGFLSHENYPIYLGSSDVFLLPMANRPYNIGRWPNKMGDYLSLARPTVSNPIGDIKTLFEKYDIGLLARWEPEDFAQKIIFYLDNPDYANQAGQKARWVSENIYNWSILGKKLESFYIKTLSHFAINKTSVGKAR
jgi:glycosyltransferase involved in cell wall biosynthesis